MNITLILIFILIVSILFLLVRRYKQEEREQLEKSKQLIKDMIDKIPKKMKKIMKKSNDTFPSGPIGLVSKIADSKENNGNKEDQMIEAFEDIKDIRYGKIGASNHNGGVTINKWIKIASFTLSGAWNARGFTLEVYPRIRYHTSGRQTLVCLVRNATTDIEAPYISLTTHNESEPNTRLIKDVRFIRTGGSGISDNTIEVWIQFGQNWADTAYVMYYLYNFGTNDFIATVPQAQVDNPPAGQAWGISDQVDPRFIETTAPWVEKIVKNNASNAYTLQGLWNNAGVRAHLFLNSNDREADGGPNTATLRNDNGDLRLQSAGGNNIHLKPSGDVGIGTSNPRSKLEVNGTISAMGGANLEGKVRFRHAGANGDDNTDPYYLEKVNTSGNYNSLRMTINDDADESFQIWGDSCRVGNCGGAGDLRHHFQATGRTQHITDDGDANSEQLIIGRTDRSNLRLGKAADYSWIQSHGSKPLKLNPVGNEVHANDVIIKGNLIFEHPNGERWVMGLRDQNHLAINKFNRPGFLIREDGNLWTGQESTGLHQGASMHRDAGWFTAWMHNSQLGRR